MKPVQPYHLLFSLLALSPALPAHAQPAMYRPTDDARIVETLPAASDPAVRALKAMRTRLATHPNDLRLTLDIARRNVELARRDADPRYLGHAEALLAPWLARRQDADLFVLQATVLQSNHRFDAASAMLDRALALAPGNAQAWLTRVTIEQVRGNYAEARNACTRLARLVDAGYALACHAGVMSLTGSGTAAYRVLEQRAASDAAADWERAGLHVSLAELAARLGRPNEARRWFRQALAESPDAYTRAAYADFLLDAHEDGAVLDLLAGTERADPLLLRLAEATRRGRHASDAPLVAALQARFDAARARGEAVHMREESRFRLRLLGDAQGALLLAQRNWSVQREPADARVLLEAALAANDRRAAQPVIDWLRETRLEDVALADLVHRIGA
jgi:tetratricopeptide (TPR) repeat protein